MDGKRLVEPECTVLLFLRLRGAVGIGTENLKLVFAFCAGPGLSGFWYWNCAPRGRISTHSEWGAERLWCEGRSEDFSRRSVGAMSREET